MPQQVSGVLPSIRSRFGFWITTHHFDTLITLCILHNRHFVAFAAMPKAELLKLLMARGIDTESPKVQTELIENADYDNEEICIPTWDDENILTKVSGICFLSRWLH